jgi:hypothetical protein
MSKEQTSKRLPFSVDPPLEQAIEASRTRREQELKGKSHKTTDEIRMLLYEALTARGLPPQKT